MYEHESKPHLLIDGLNLSYGGGVVVMSRLAIAFAMKGYQVTILTSRDLPDSNFEGYDINNVLEPNARGALRSLIYRRFNLNSRAKRIGAEAVLSFNYFSNTILPQVTYHINVIPFLKFKERINAVGFIRAVAQKSAALTALRKSKANIFESKYVYSLATSTGVKIQNPEIAYIGADFVDKHCNSVEERVSGQIITITSGAKHKRNDLTIAFFRQMLSVDPSAKLGIVGNADAILASLNYEDRHFVKTSPSVVLYGYVDRKSLYELLSKAKAFITFSELESFFMVAIEAMSVGCPVIAADNSSVRESIGNAGILISPCEVNSAVEAIQKLSDTSTFLQFDRAGRAWAAEFDANQCALKFVSTYEGKVSCKR